MSKKQTVAIKELYNLVISNTDDYGSRLKIILEGLNTKGNIVKVTLNAEMFWAKQIAYMSKKSVDEFAQRVNSMRSDFNQTLNKTP